MYPSNMDGIKDRFLWDKHFKGLDIQNQVNTLKHTLVETISLVREYYNTPASEFATKDNLENKSQADYSVATGYTDDAIGELRREVENQKQKFNEDMAEAQKVIRGMKTRIEKLEKNV